MPSPNEILVGSLNEDERAQWGRAVALMVEHKADFGAAEVPDEQIRNLAPSFWMALTTAAHDAMHGNDNRSRARLRRLQWFLDFVQNAEHIGRLPGQAVN